MNINIIVRMIRGININIVAISIIFHSVYLKYLLDLYLYLGITDGGYFPHR